VYFGDGVFDCSWEEVAGAGVFFIGGVGGCLGISKDSTGFAGSSLDIGRGGAGVAWVVCLECKGDRARPMRLGRQLLRLYPFASGAFDTAAPAGGPGFAV
jgi:hypothetical protein